ncbi:MAG TPA: ornithine cyclodeaminase family protein [Candidatus Limnocylindria bacterium]|nr:ornithine cyclodeaminase family protein [Candidatus Limnocylindria bacterium]
MKLRVLSADDVTSLLPMRDCIEVMERALAAFARGQVVQPVRLMTRTMDESGVLALMPAYVGGIGFGFKAVTVFHGNDERGLPSHQGIITLIDAETGTPLALMDGTRITAMRTAAVSAVATRHLARTDASVATIIGTGVQARAHAEALACVRELSEIRIVGRRPEAARALATELADHLPTRAFDDAAAALDGADIVATVTASPAPVFAPEAIAPGTHINAVGAYTATTREVPSETVAAARVFVDDRTAALSEAGDLLLAIADGAIDESHVVGTLGEVLIGQVQGRTDAQQITIFESLGLGLEDIAAASHVYGRALEDGIGTDVEI